MSGIKIYQKDMKILKYITYCLITPENDPLRYKDAIVAGNGRKLLTVSWVH